MQTQPLTDIRNTATWLISLAFGAAAWANPGPTPAANAIYSATEGLLAAPAINIPGGGVHAATLRAVLPGQPLAVGSLLNLVSSRGLSLQEATSVSLPQTYRVTDQKAPLKTAVFKACRPMQIADFSFAYFFSK